MSAPAIKLPLAVKKAIKDQEPEKVTLLARLETALGFPATFNYSFDAAWSALEGHENQERLPMVTLQYFKVFIEAVEENFKDPITKSTVLAYFTSKNVTFTIEPTSFNGEEYKKTHPCVFENYCGIRLIDGGFDIFTKYDRFWTNVNDVCRIQFTELFEKLPLKEGELPLHTRKELAKNADKITEVKARIAKALGVDAVQWNIEADAAAILARKDARFIEFPFHVDMALAYMKNLAELLEAKCADEMVKEAVQEVFSAKTVSLKVYDSLEGLKGLETHDNYNGVQFLDGQLNVFAPPNNWACNVNQLCYIHDLIKLF